MTCPEKGTWYHKDKKVFDLAETRVLEYSNDVKGLHRCDFGTKKYYFYVQGKGE